MTQPDGGYPRLNASMMKSGKFNSMIVSLVGKFASTSPAEDGCIDFVCCDQGRVKVSLEQAEPPENLVDRPDMCFELIGQVTETGDFQVGVPSSTRIESSSVPARVLSSDPICFVLLDHSYLLPGSCLLTWIWGYTIK